MPGLDAVVPEDMTGIVPTALSGEIGLLQETTAPQPDQKATAKKVVALLKQMLKKKQAALEAHQRAEKAKQVKKHCSPRPRTHNPREEGEGDE